MKRAKIFPVALAALALLCVSACGSRPGALSDAPEEKELSPADRALEVAEEYREVYMSVYGGGAFQAEFDGEAMEKALACLEERGLAAVDAQGCFDMKNAGLVSAFLDAAAEKASAEVDIYQLYTDGGLICHSLRTAGGRTSVTLTRLAWLDGGKFALPGDVPTVTYSDEYTVLSAALSDEGFLVYEYDMPDNPAGSNHDGHIDTTVKIRVTP